MKYPEKSVASLEVLIEYYGVLTSMLSKGLYKKYTFDVVFKYEEDRCLDVDYIIKLAIANFRLDNNYNHNAVPEYHDGDLTLGVLPSVIFKNYRIETQEEVDQRKKNMETELKNIRIEICKNKLQVASWLESLPS